MYIRWIGAALIISGCGYFGFSMAGNYKKQQFEINQLHIALSYMLRELSCRHTDLPKLFMDASNQIEGAVCQVLSDVAKRLLENQAEEASVCFAEAIYDKPKLQPQTQQLLREIGTDIGKFDLEGQISSLQRSCDQCQLLMTKLSDEREMRTRNYQTLSLCAGVALAILLM